MSPRGGEQLVTARRVLVSGLVQGVGYRWSAMVQAGGLGVAGWARNLPDGRVEVHAQGAPSAVEAFVAWLKQGPVGAGVSSVVQEVVAADPRLEDFTIRR